MSDTTNDIDALLFELREEDKSCKYGALTALVAERDGLRAELDAAIEQRDDARRDACAFEAIAHWEKAHPNGIMSECAVVRISREIAFERGWDCFKKRGGA